MNPRNLKAMNVLLRLRQREEELAAQGLAMVSSQARRLARDLDDVESVMTQQVARARRVAAAGRSPSREVGPALAQLRATAGRIAGQLDAMEEQVAVERQHVAEALKRRKAVDQLISRLREGAQREADRRDVKEGDDQHQAFAASAAAWETP